MAFLPFVLQRARTHWQILITLSLGVILTTALLASGPLLVDTVIEMGLYRTFQSSDVARANLRLTTHTQVDQVDFQALDSEIQALLRTALGKHVDHIARVGQTEVNQDRCVACDVYGLLKCRVGAGGHDGPVRQVAPRQVRDGFLQVRHEERR